MRLVLLEFDLIFSLLLYTFYFILSPNKVVISQWAQGALSTACVEAQ